VTDQSSATERLWGQAVARSRFPPIPPAPEPALRSRPSAHAGLNVRPPPRFDSHHLPSFAASRAGQEPLCLSHPRRKIGPPRDRCRRGRLLGIRCCRLCSPGTAAKAARASMASNFPALQPMPGQRAPHPPAERRKAHFPPCRRGQVHHETAEKPNAHTRPECDSDIPSLLSASSEEDLIEIQWIRSCETRSLWD